MKLFFALPEEFNACNEFYRAMNLDDYFTQLFSLSLRAGHTQQAQTLFGGSYRKGLRLIRSRP